MQKESDASGANPSLLPRGAASRAWEETKGAIVSPPVVQNREVLMRLISQLAVLSLPDFSASLIWAIGAGKNGNSGGKRLWWFVVVVVAG